MKKSLPLVLALLLSPLAGAAVQRADYDRAVSINTRYQSLTSNVVRSFSWVEGEHFLLYSKTASNSVQFFLRDADTGTTSPAFDQKKVAAALGRALHTEVKAEQLPFTDARLVEHRAVLEFSIRYQPYWCELAKDTCALVQQSSETNEGPNMLPQARNSDSRTMASPDNKWQALILNYNVALRSTDGKQTVVLSTDGSEGDYYSLASVAWSPDSNRLVAYRIRPGYRRMLRFVQSSPPNQLQPLYPEIEYTKPGDTLDLQQPVLFDLQAHRSLPIANDLFHNPYELSPPVWWNDSRGFTFEYNARGHQLYRVIEVNGNTAAARTFAEERSDTFVDYRRLVSNQQDTGKIFRKDLADGKEILWASERDGWEHLYLLDGATGNVKQQITSGQWVVRSVDRVDEKQRLLWFTASGRTPGEDPYYVHAYRCSFDGSGLVALDPTPGNHSVQYSDDGQFAADLVSTVATPPILTLSHTAGAPRPVEIEHGSIDALRTAGWQAPEPFTAKGRDGTTDIWGLVWKPVNFDPAKHYPVIEDIYAGPQGSFVPKSFSTRVEPLTTLGFVVVQIDGMGTNNRSKAFHATAWKNLKDAGFPDRIAWHRAYASTHPWYDITRVGIFGTSAGGQNAMGALLFHPDFYQAAVANSGCHDNRMDKIWWNEQWMGWPIGPQYSASSNVDHAGLLRGKLMLVVGEMDDNVDPSSTFQVVDRLERANKEFDLLYVPGGRHGAGGDYGQRALQTFFVRNLLGEPTPAWNRTPEPSATPAILK